MTESLPKEVDTHIVTLLNKISTLRDNHQSMQARRRPTMSTELWSLELWRAVAVECFATFLFSFVVFGAPHSCTISNNYNTGTSYLSTAVAAGLSIAAISLIFGHISGSHVNPAVSVTFALSNRISPLRAALYIIAQCGGGIAGAAVMYGATSTKMHQGRPVPSSVERLVVELSLSIFIILAHFTADSKRNLPGYLTAKPAAVLGAAYTSATLIRNPNLNPARALGFAFVMNRWDSHWVYWVGPIAGGMIAGFLYEYVLNPRRSKDPRELDDGDNSSIRSDEDNYDDLDKPPGPKFPGSYATYRPVAGASSSIYSAPPTALERVESIYGGTKSLYCKSPPLTRANLNRSQSVYAKSTSGTRDGLMFPKPGPLVPAQSLYPIRIGTHASQNYINRETTHQHQTSQTPQSTQNHTQNHNSTNQNMQNQLQQCTQSIYGVRGISTTLSNRDNGVYGISTGTNIYGRAPAPPPERQSSQQTTPSQSSTPQNHQNQPNGPLNTSDTGSSSRRPESMYGQTARRSDDSAYGSYQSSSRGNYAKNPGPPPPPPLINGPPCPPQYRDGRPSPAGPIQQNQSQHNFQRNSPNPQY